MGFSTIGGAGGGSEETPAGDGTSQVAFKTVAVSGQSDVVADGAEDTLTLAAGSNVTITTNAGTDTVTIASSGGGAALDGIDDQSSSNDDQITIKDTEVVINEDSDDLNFRVESNSSANGVFFDGGTGNLGVGTGTPLGAIQVFKDLNAADDLGDFDNYHLVLNNSVGTTGDTVGMLLSSSGDTYGGSAIVHYDTGPGGKGELAFLTKQATSASPPTEVMRLGSDGAIAIAKSSAPSATADYSKIYAREYGNDANTVLLLTGDGSDSGTTFTDSSTGGSTHTFTQTGNAHTDTTVKKFGTASMQFDGTGDAVHLSTEHADFNVGTGDFTADGWFNFSAVSASQYLFEIGIYTAGFSWFWSSTDKFMCYVSGNSTTKMLDGTEEGNAFEPVVGQWYHLAIQRRRLSNTTARISVFVDGIELCSSTSTGNLGSISSATHGVSVGSSASTPGGTCVNGYIDNFRFSNVARYRSNFDPPGAAYPLVGLFTKDSSGSEIMLAGGGASTAPAIDNGVLTLSEESSTPASADDTAKLVALEDGIDSTTSLMLHGNGSNGGTTITDSSTANTKTCTAVGNTHTDTTVKKYGTASIQFDGTGDYVTVPDHADFTMGSGDFTYEFWVRFDAVPNDAGFFGQTQSTGTGGDTYEKGMYCYYEGGDDRVYFRWRSATDASIRLQLSFRPHFRENSWYHVAIVRDGPMFIGYINGKAQYKNEGTDIMPGNHSVVDCDGTFEVAKGNVYAMNAGYMEEFRVTKGVAKYKTDFVPPGSAFPLTRMYAVNSAGDKTLIG